MEATIVPDRLNHYPVLLKEIISIISPQYGGTFIDCTFGQGGYSKEILKYSNTKVIGIDRDIKSKKIADQISRNYEDRFFFKNIKFSQLNNLKLKNENIKGVIFDLGYSLNQIKDGEKGLSFSSQGQLNMKLGLNNFFSLQTLSKYLYELNALCEDLEIQLSLLNTDRLEYEDFKKAYIPKMTQYLTTNPIIPPLEWKRCIREITLDYPELLNIDDSEDNKMWPWYGDLISDPNNDDIDAPHVRYPTTFYRKFKKTPRDKYLSTCCGKKQMKVVYNCENNNP